MKHDPEIAFGLANPAQDAYLGAMSKRATAHADRPTTATLRTAGAEGGAAGREVRFGDVVVTGSAPSEALVAAQVARSSEALARLATRLVRPGIGLRARKGVPRFSVDPVDPQLFVRELDGRTERGRLVDGTFQVVD